MVNFFNNLESNEVGELLKRTNSNLKEKFRRRGEEHEVREIRFLNLVEAALQGISLLKY